MLCTHCNKLLLLHFFCTFVIVTFLSLQQVGPDQHRHHKEQGKWRRRGFGRCHTLIKVKSIKIAELKCKSRLTMYNLKNPYSLLNQHNKDNNLKQCDFIWFQPAVKSTVTLSMAQDREAASSVVNDTTNLNRYTIHIKYIIHWIMYTTYSYTAHSYTVQYTILYNVLCTAQYSSTLYTLRYSSTVSALNISHNNLQKRN